MTFRVPEQYRVRSGRMASDERFKCNGAFMVPNECAPVKGQGARLAVIASEEGGWEHVSVSLPHRCPTWEEMCFIKRTFWGPEDVVIQCHPPEADYVNFSEHCLHLWRSVDQQFPMPPSWMVGPKS